MSDAGTAAVSCPAFTNVVVSELPFQVTCAFPVKPAPLTVSVKPGLPAIALCGEMLEIDRADVIVNVRGDGCGVVLMLTDAVPTDAISADGTVAVSCPELTKFVASGLPFHVI